MSDRLTDIQRVELALPSRLLFNVVTSAWAQQYNPLQAKLLELLKAAANEPVADLDYRHKCKVVRRIEGVSRGLSQRFTKREVTSWNVGMAIYYFLEDMLQDGTMELYEGAPLAEAFALLLPEMDKAFANEAMDRFAKKQAIQLRADAQAMGFYLTPGANNGSETANT